MSKKHSALEVVKTCLIVLLALSAIFLAERTQLFNAFFPDLLGGSGTADQSNMDFSAFYREASRPVNIVLTAEGGHYSGDVQLLYEDCGALLGEALGSSRSPMSATAADWRGALAADSVYYEYPYPVRLSVLAGWFGTEIMHEGADHMVRRLCLTAGAADPVLYYLDVNGNIYRCGTSASASTLESLTTRYLPNETYFLFELEPNYRYADPYMLLQEELTTLPELLSTNAMNNLADSSALLDCFDMNAYISSHYTEQGGTQVYVEGDCTLRITADGLLSFRQGTDGERLSVFPSSSGDEAAAIEGCRVFLGRLSALIGGSGSFSFQSCENNRGSYTLRFSLFVGNVELFFPDYEPAAELVIENGYISQVRLYFRSYTLGQSQQTLLPARQAAAIAESEAWPEAVPGWLDDLRSSTLSPQWLLKGGN